MGGGSDDPRPGFDKWVSFKGQGHYLPPGPNYTLNVDGARVKQKGYITDELTDYAIDWLKEQAKKSLFLTDGNHQVTVQVEGRHGGTSAGRQTYHPRPVPTEVAFQRSCLG